MLRLPLAGLLISVPSLIWAQQCQAPAVGQHCNARVGRPPDSYSLPDATAGNPIHTASGNKTHHDWDLFALAHRDHIGFGRFYSAQGLTLGSLGAQWQHHYEIRLTQSADRYVVHLPGEASVLLSEQASSQGFIRAGTTAHEYTWYHHSGDRYTFVQGRLRHLVKNGQNIYFDYYPADSPWPHQLQHIRTERTQLVLQYQQHGGRYYLQQLHSPIGVIRYHYDQPAASELLRLQQVHYPDGRSLHYLYEPEQQRGHPFALTGISIQHQPNGQLYRLRYWAYDSQGRAIYSAQEDQQQAVEIQYPTTNTHPIRVRSDMGEQQQTLNPAQRLISTTGKACPGCPPTNLKITSPRTGQLHINTLHLQQRPNGLTLNPEHAGWPHLQLHYDATGQLQQWFSELSGHTRWAYDLNGMPLRQTHANGDQLTVTRQSKDHRWQLDYRSAAQHSQTVVHWPEPTRLLVQHPHDTQEQRFDRNGNLLYRRITRPSTSNSEDRYRYDNQGRLLEHTLPEGGSLHYGWSTRSAQLLTIVWQNATGKRITLLRPQPGGYAHANNLVTQLDYTLARQAYTLSVRSDQKLYYLSTRSYHTDSGALRSERHAFPQLPHSQRFTFGYNAQRQTVVVQGDQGSPLFYAWSETGALAHTNSTAMLHIQRDASGLASSVQSPERTLTLRYGPQRQLQQVWQQQQQLARYSHNAFGQLTEAHYPHESRYFYISGTRLEQEHRRATPTAPVHESRRYIYAHDVPIAMLRYIPNQATELYNIHSDWLGAPHSMTDQDGAIVWAAQLSPFGHAQLLVNSVDLPLRLPGQYADPLTGWHHNGYRTYLPQQGQYLEPDPLGPIPGLQALGYARQQPRRYADPTGLVLFAFDGTRQNQHTDSNVQLFSQLYDGDSFYQAGPGNPYYVEWDAITASQAQQIIQNQWAHLLNIIERSQRDAGAVLPIDILGFSRGAALARHFANLLVQHTQDGWFQYQHPQRGQLAMCVQLRFMGLFDTVAQFGLSGSANHLYDLSISPVWGWVAHAVALNEHRWMFPLYSLDVAANLNRLEQAFIGAHSDIGGGHDLLEPQPGDLSRVALMWMLWQARGVGLNFRDLPNDDTTVSDPILHDERSALERYLLNSDRRVQSPSHPANNLYQYDHPELGKTVRDQVEAFLRRFDDWRTRDDNQVAEVDMPAYYRWLAQQNAQTP